MDPYTSERWILERHLSIVREAERRARLVPEATGSGVFNIWVAGRLRELADRLDGRGRMERAAQ
jgi:hypothetical protein